MKFLIAGLGSIGRRHLRNLQALGEQDIILLRSNNSTLPDDDLVGMPFETDLAAALAHKPDAVIISNPTAHHLNVAIPAAQAGCHLLIEKPISHTWDRIEELQSAVDISGSQVLVGFQFRFHPGLMRISSLLAEEAIGRPLSVRAHWGEYLPDWHPWEDYRKGYSARAEMGGGVVLTLCHPLDYLHWLLGDISALWAWAGQTGDLELDVEDCAEIGLRFENGVIGSLHLDYLQRPPKHHLEIIGTQGTLRWDNSDGSVKLYQAEVEQWETFSTPDEFERNQLYLTEMQHFIQVVSGKAEPACNLLDGIAALRLALGVLDSSRQSRIVTFE